MNPHRKHFFVMIYIQIDIFNKHFEFNYKKRFVSIDGHMKTCDYLRHPIFLTAGHELMVILMCMFIDP